MPTFHKSSSRNRIYKRLSVEERFWQYVEKGDDCWLWTGATTKFGHGVMNSGAPKYRTLRAHRVSWELHNGPIPKGKCVLHRCDVPACVNPSHLFVGTRGDNNQDMADKGRANGPQFRGESHPAAKLTEEDVRSIRAEYKATKPALRVLGEKYGVSLQTIFRIIKRQNWTHI